MYHGAAIDRAGDFEHRDFAGAAIDFDFGGLRREVVRTRLVAVAAVIWKLGRIVEIAHADNRLAVRLIDMRAHDGGDRLEIGFTSAPRTDFTIEHSQLFRWQFKLRGCGVEQLF